MPIISIVDNAVVAVLFNHNSRRDSINKTINNVLDDTSPSVYLLSVPCQIEPFDIENSHSTKKIAGYTYRKEEEEHTFVESETENEDMTQDDELSLYHPI